MNEPSDEQKNGHEGRIRHAQFLRTGMAATGGGEPQHVTHVLIPLEVEADRALLTAEPWSHMFPFALEAASRIAGREAEDRRGLDMTARGDVQDLSVEVWETGPAETPAFSFPLAKVKGRPRLRIAEDGESWIDIKVIAPLTSAELAKLGPYTDGDCFVTLRPTQQTLPAMSPTKPARTVVRRATPAVADDQPTDPLGTDWDFDGVTWNPDAYHAVKTAAELNHTTLDEAGLRKAVVASTKLAQPGRKKAWRVTLDHAQDVIRNFARPPAIAG